MGAAWPVCGVPYKSEELSSYVKMIKSVLFSKETLKKINRK